MGDQWWLGPFTVTAVQRKPCPGWPIGAGCLTLIPVNASLCQFDERTARELMAKEEVTGMTPVGLVDPFGICACGGDSNAPQHRQTLHHRKWEWSESQKARASR